MKDSGKRLVLFALVMFHLAVLFANFVSIFILPFVTPWYVSFPIITLIVNLMFTPVSCPLTKMENRIRRSLGMKEIRHFVGHYIVWPIKRRIKNR